MKSGYTGRIYPINAVGVRHTGQDIARLRRVLDLSVGGVGHVFGVEGRLEEASHTLQGLLPVDGGVGVGVPQFLADQHPRVVRDVLQRGIKGVLVVISRLFGHVFLEGLGLAVKQGDGGVYQHRHAYRADDQEEHYPDDEDLTDFRAAPLALHHCSPPSSSSCCDLRKMTCPLRCSICRL